MELLHDFVARPLRRPQRVMLSVAELPEIASSPSDELETVTGTFPFRTNDYYASLIDWDDPRDPIRRLIVPSTDELLDEGELDPCKEAENTPVRGLQHKYGDTALLLVTDQCASFCRYCFRKRLFMADTRETSRRVELGLRYIAAHPEISDVLLTGGDPLTLPASRLSAILRATEAIPHVRTIRIGSKLPAFNPARIFDDQALLHAVREVTSHGKAIYVMCHFDHPREITQEAITAIKALQKAGATTVNQCPITSGVNDDADVLSELFRVTTEIGCPQYYVFQCRPTIGNRMFSVPLTRAYQLFVEAQRSVSGLSRRARFCMSHARGKVEVVGLDEGTLFARYHRAKDPADHGSMLLFHRDDEAHWLDDLRPVAS